MEYLGFFIQFFGSALKSRRRFFGTPFGPNSTIFRQRFGNPSTLRPRCGANFALRFPILLPRRWPHRMSWMCRPRLVNWTGWCGREKPNGFDMFSEKNGTSSSKMWGGHGTKNNWNHHVDISGKNRWPVSTHLSNGSQSGSFRKQGLKVKNICQNRHSSII